MLYALLTRTLLDINVLHDRNPVALSDGSIRNAYTVRLLNKRGLRVIAIDVPTPRPITPCRRRRQDRP